MKKLLALALVTVLAFSLLTACTVNVDKEGGGTSSPPSGNNSTNTPGGNETPSSTPSGGNDNTPTPGGNDNTPSGGGVSISLNKADYAAGEKITVSYSGITAEMVTAQAWVGIAKVGATAGDYHDWEYVKQGSGQVQLDAPSGNGSYEVRFYQGYLANPANLVESASVSFTVGGGSGTANGGNNGGGEVTPVKLRTEEEVLAILTNFSMSFKCEAGGENPYTLHQTICKEGTLFKQTGDYPDFYFADFVNKRYISLDEASKTGKSEAFTPWLEEITKGFDWNISAQLFYTESTMEALIPVGTDTIIGRAVTLYSYPEDMMGTRQVYYVDNEYGFPLKYTQGDTLSIEATEFKVGGVTVAGMINLDEYTLTED